MQKSLVLAAALAGASFPAAADTVTADTIAAALSDSYTELEQETWWNANMADARHEISGVVSDVEKGTFSGYWVDLDIGSNIRVRCGFGDEYEKLVILLRKGQAFTCKGRPGSTWVAVFGITFQMDYDG